MHSCHQQARIVVGTVGQIAHTQEDVGAHVDLSITLRLASHKIHDARYYIGLADANSPRKSNVDKVCVSRVRRVDLPFTPTVIPLRNDIWLGGTPSCEETIAGCGFC